MSAKTLPDWSGVVDRLIAGDRLALLELTRLVNGFLSRWGAYDFRAEWDDLVQEVVLAVVLAVRDGRLREPRAVFGFVRSTARFKLVDRLRARFHGGEDRRLPLEDGLAEEPEDEGASPETRRDLEAALARLPEKKREAVVQVYWQGRSYEEAAEHTGIPLGTLKRYLREGLAQLRDELADRLGPK